MQRLREIAEAVTFDFEGDEVRGQAGEPVAVSLLAQGTQTLTRSLKYHRPRGPFCFAGACAQCLVRIDGVPNLPACQTPVRAGMRVERQNGFPDVDVDVFAATDVVFRKWFDHHSFLAGVRPAQPVLLRVARALAGLGPLPDAPGEAPPPAVVEHAPVVVIGAGAAGLAVSERLAAAGQPFVLLEREAEAGGRFRWDPRGQLPPAVASIRTGAAVVGVFADDGAPIVAVRWQGRFHLVHAERLVLATGSAPALLAFENNDRPGIFAWRAVLQLARLHGVLAGRRVACVGEPTLSLHVAEALRGLGSEPVAVGAQPLHAHGRSKVTSVTVRRDDGQLERVPCDALAVCIDESPSFELAAAAGVAIEWKERFVASADADGRTAKPHVFVAGAVAGASTLDGAVASGVRAADALVASLRGAP